MWYILGIISLVVLFLFWKGKNAVWGGFTIGNLGGLIYAMVELFSGNEFDWLNIVKGIIIGTLLGTIFESIRRITRKEKLWGND